MTADKEHIEGFSADYSALYRYLVHNNRKSDGYCKYGECFEYGFKLRFYVSASDEEDSDREHRAVADHCLNVDSDKIREHVCRVYHNTQTCEDRIRR